MAAEDKWLLIRNYDLWAHLTDEEYDELNIVHNFIEAPKGDYIYFEAYHHNRLYFIKEGYIRVGFIDDSGQEVIKEIIQKRRDIRTDHPGKKQPERRICTGL